MKPLCEVFEFHHIFFVKIRCSTRVYHLKKRN